MVSKCEHMFERDREGVRMSLCLRRTERKKVTVLCVFV